MSSLPAGGGNDLILGMNFSPAGAKDLLTPKELGTLGKNFLPAGAREVSLKMTWVPS